ncbi:hypothetical protein DRN74_02550 [Candidatus Micrarchaeota archaeon]|nr:MAG: hypothetical protein DRN74_02550 [Candidatus Micrarchaeota archaeon]
MKAQSSLEYLVIVAVVLGIVAAVSYFMLSPVPGFQKSGSISICRQAAIECYAKKQVNPEDPCKNCDSACLDSSGNELFEGALRCCKAGRSSAIYEGSQENCMESPIADFTYDCQENSEGITECDFDATSSYDTDGYIQTYSWQVDFLDSDRNSYRATGPYISLALEGGRNRVTLTVTDNDGLSASKSEEITGSYGKLSQCSLYLTREECQSDPDCKWCDFTGTQFDYCTYSSYSCEYGSRPPLLP